MAKIMKKAKIQPSANDAKLTAKGFTKWEVVDAETGNTAPAILLRRFGCDIGEEEAKANGIKANRGGLLPFRAALAAYDIGEKVTGAVVKALAYSAALAAYIKTEAAAAALRLANSRKASARKQYEAAAILVAALYAAIDKRGTQAPQTFAEYLEAAAALRKGGEAAEAVRASVEAAAALITAQAPTMREAEEAAAAAFAEFEEAEAEAKAARDKAKAARDKENEAAAAFVRDLAAGRLNTPEAEKMKAAAAEAVKAAAAAAAKPKRGKK